MLTDTPCLVHHIAASSLQSVLILLSGRTDYAIFTYYLPFFNPDFTFNLCISPEFTAYGRLLLQLVTPSYILLLLVIVIVLTRYTRLSKLLGKHSFLQGLWLLFIVSYFNISNSALELLHCRATSSTQGTFTPICPLTGRNSPMLLRHASPSSHRGPHPADHIRLSDAYLRVRFNARPEVQAGE